MSRPLKSRSRMNIPIRKRRHACFGTRKEKLNCKILEYLTMGPHDFVQTGCATDNMCTTSGCALNSTTEQFICCCTHPFCNGKSHRMVKARWRMFQNGDYRQPAPRKPATRSASPRLMLEIYLYNTKTSTVLPPKATVHYQQEVKKKTEPVPKTNPKEVVTKLAVTKATSTTIPPKITSKIAATTTNKAIVGITTVKPMKKVAGTKAAVNTSTAKPIQKLSATTSTKSIPKNLPVVPSVANNSAVIKLAESTTVAVPMAKLPEYKATSSTAEPSKISTMISLTPKTTVITTTQKFVTEPAAANTVAASTPLVSIQKSATKQEATPLITNKLQANNEVAINQHQTTSAEAVASSSSTELPASSSTTTADGKKRTTRAPIKQPNVTYQLPVAYPWYWICLLGFGVASLIFLGVFACLRRCGKCRRQDAGRPQRLQEEENHSNGHINNVSNPIIKNGKRKVKRRSENSLIKSKNVVNGTTDESLVSRCTTVTTASSNGQSDAGFGEEDGLGRELTVIDPLLNKSYSGNLQGDNTTKH
uniref:MANSC domain-containing protein n=1 Tax=Ditylenchus dipsaci TaxID=166011 RepID=A0A915E3Z8_9BILA